MPPRGKKIFSLWAARKGKGGKSPKMRVQTATEADIPAWLLLAAEVESLFGPMVDDPGFLNALARNIERESAFCIREQDGKQGVMLLGGVLFSPHPPQYRIGWLAVASRHRRKGVGKALVEHVLTLVQASAEVSVITFGEDNEAGRPARKLYERFGFEPSEPAPGGPEVGSRQVFRLWIK
jgi:ribosomal protein S18 acetylase RimI-like enzyme